MYGKRKLNYQFKSIEIICIYYFFDLIKFFILNRSYQDIHDAFGEKDRVRVIVRIRPINELEKSKGSNEIISCDRTSLIV